jgi:hypothetical protein
MATWAEALIEGDSHSVALPLPCNSIWGIGPSVLASSSPIACGESGSFIARTLTWLEAGWLKMGLQESAQGGEARGVRRLRKTSPTTPFQRGRTPCACAHSLQHTQWWLRWGDLQEGAVGLVTTSAKLQLHYQRYDANHPCKAAAHCACVPWRGLQRQQQRQLAVR